MNYGDFATPALFFRAVGANLISPARGMFVFTPVFVFSAISLAKRSWRSPLAPWLAACASCS